MITKFLKISLALSISSSICFAQRTQTKRLTSNHIIPKPLSVNASQGTFELKANTTFYYTKDALAPIGVFTALLKSSTGINFKATPLKNEKGRKVVKLL